MMLDLRARSRFCSPAFRALGYGWARGTPGVERIQFGGHFRAGKGFQGGPIRAKIGISRQDGPVGPPGGPG